MRSEENRKRRRRRCSREQEEKAQILAECDARGASVAKVAMSRGINANIVHRWRKLQCPLRLHCRHATGAAGPNIGQAVPQETRSFK
jgi:transposase-like protein